MKNTGVLASTCLVFFALGLMTAAIGPVLPQLADQAGSTLAAIGAVFTAMFLGALAAQVFVGPVGDRVGMRSVFLGGMVLLALGTLGVTLSNHLWLTLALALLSGIGHGAVDLGGTVLIAGLFNGRSVSALNLLNVFFGLGAFAGPAIAGFSMRRLDTGLPALWISSALLFAALPLLGVMLVRRKSPRAGAGAGVPAASGAGLYRTPMLYGLGLIILLYVGIENGMGGWTTEYVQRTVGFTTDRAAMVTSGFWLALTLGRMLSAGLGLRLKPTVLLAGATALAVAGGALLAFGVGAQLPTVAGVALIGFCFGPVYPTMMAITTGAFPNTPGKAAGLVAASGSLGGMALPWVQGVALERLGAPYSAWFTLLGIAVMLAIMLIAFSMLQRRAAMLVIKPTGAD